MLECGGPAGVSPERIPLVLCPGHQIVATSKSNPGSLIQAIPSPIAISTAIELEYRKRVRKFLYFPRLSVRHDMTRSRQLEIRDTGVCGRGRRLTPCAGKNRQSEDD